MTVSNIEVGVQERRRILKGAQHCTLGAADQILEMIRVVGLNKVFLLGNRCWNPPRDVCVFLEVATLCWEVVLSEEKDICMPGNTGVA